MGRSCITRSTAATINCLVNTHIYGVMANNAPFFHLRKIPGGAMAATTLKALSTSGTKREPLPEGKRA